MVGSGVSVRRLAYPAIPQKDAGRDVRIECAHRVHAVWPGSTSFGVFFSRCGVILVGLSLPGIPRGPNFSRCISSSDLSGSRPLIGSFMWDLKGDRPCEQAFFVEQLFLGEVPELLVPVVWL